MNTKSKLTLALKWALALVFVTALMGCATSTQVKEIVDASNAAIIQASLFPDRAALNGDGTTQTDAELDNIAKRVAIFVEAYPDRPKTINPLRLRLAWAYLNADRPASATAIYNEVDKEHLTFETQKIIYTHFEDFVWWFKAANNRWTITDRERAEKVIEGMRATAGQQDRTDYLRAWLSYTAAKIGVMLAANNREAAFKTITKNTLDAYRDSFTEKEQNEARNTSVQAAGAADRPDDETMLRWYLSVPAVYDEASENWNDIFDVCLPAEITGDWISCNPIASGGCGCAYNPP